MTEIKKTLAILKARWPEVTLIAGLHILGMLSNKLFRAAKPDLARTWVLLYMAFSFLIMIISIILYLGFLRTVYLEGQKHQSPLVLLRIGKHFFWRMVGFGLLWGLVYLILAWLIFLITKQLTSIDTGFFETAKVAPLVYQLCFIAAMLILIKPFLFIPALIIVLDCGVFVKFQVFQTIQTIRCKGISCVVLCSDSKYLPLGIFTKTR